MHTPGLRAVVGAVIALTAAAVMAGCSNTSAEEPSPSPTPTTSSSAVPTISATAIPKEEYISTVAYVKGTEIDVSDTPGGPVTQTIKAEDVLITAEGGAGGGLSGSGASHVTTIIGR